MNDSDAKNKMLVLQLKKMHCEMMCPSFYLRADGNAVGVFVGDPDLVGLVDGASSQYLWQS